MAEKHIELLDHDLTKEEHKGKTLHYVGYNPETNKVWYDYSAPPVNWEKIDWGMAIESINGLSIWHHDGKTYTTWGVVEEEKGTLTSEFNADNKTWGAGFYWTTDLVGPRSQGGIPNFWGSDIFHDEKGNSYISLEESNYDFYFCKLEPNSTQWKNTQKVRGQYEDGFWCWYGPDKKCYLLKGTRWSEIYVFNSDNVEFEAIEYTINGQSQYLPEYSVGYDIWKDSNGVYYFSSGDIHYTLDHTTMNFTTKTWEGLSNFKGRYVWHGKSGKTYFSDGDNQYELKNGVWVPKEWTYGFETTIKLKGDKIWNDINGEAYCHASENEDWVLDKE